jgi:succinate dehydrogenase / fumarate reductase flavoprotein subunit
MAPFSNPGGENPYAIQQELQQMMNDYVGIIRTEDELKQALVEIEKFKERAARVGVKGTRQYNPAWHIALDLPHQLVVSECIARAALGREESRGGHTRDDFAKMSPEWRQVNLICYAEGTGVRVEKQALPTIPQELVSLFDSSELSKYMTQAELDSIAQGTA